MFIYFDQLYSVIFFFAEIILFLFKGNYLPYPPGQLGPEIVGIFFYLAVQLTRLRIGKLIRNNCIIIIIASTGNKTEMPMYLVYSIFLSAPVFFAYAFYLQFQTYSLAFDLSLTVIGMFFLGCEIIVSVFSAFSSLGKNNLQQ